MGEVADRPGCMLERFGGPNRLACAVAMEVIPQQELAGARLARRRLLGRKSCKWGRNAHAGRVESDSMPDRVYIETTFVSYLTARPSRDVVFAAHQQITHEWWDTRRTNFETLRFPARVG